MEIYCEENEKIKSTNNDLPLKKDVRNNKKVRKCIFKKYIVYIFIIMILTFIILFIYKQYNYNEKEDSENYSEIIKMPNGNEKFTVDNDLNIYYTIPKVKKNIKLKFENWFSGFNYKNNVFTTQLSKRYNVTISNDDPDYIIYSVYYGHKNKNSYEDKIKILYSEELKFPDFHKYDYSITYNNIKYLDRHLRKIIVQFAKKYKYNTTRQYRPGKKFCAIVVSNCHPKLRREFFKELSKYKKVDSGGGCWNNIGYKIKSGRKATFFNNYKFSIVFESYQHVGYATEKLYDGLLGNTIPIYFGDFTVTEIVNPKAIIHIRNKSEFNEKIELIKKIDQDDNLYKQYLKEPIFLDKNFVKKEVIKYYSFFFHIFDQDYESAKRRANGW